MAQDPPGTEPTLIKAESIYDVVHDVITPTVAPIVARLVTGGLSVHELAEQLPVERRTVSNTLSWLRRYGLVYYEQKGKSRVYHTTPGTASMRANGELHLRFRTRDGGQASLVFPPTRLLRKPRTR